MAKEQTLFRQHLSGMGKKERRSFLLGLVGVLALSLTLILVMIQLVKDARVTDVSDRLVGIAIFACYLGITLWRMKRLWQTGFPSCPARGFLPAASKMYSAFAEVIHAIVSITGIVGAGFTPIICNSAPVSDLFLGITVNGFFLASFSLGVAACSAFHASWHKNKLAGKKAY